MIKLLYWYQHPAPKLCVKLFLICLVLVFSISSVSAQYNYKQKHDSIFYYVNQVVYGKGELVIRHSYKYIPNNLARFSQDIYNEYQANNFDEPSREHLNYLIAIAIIHQQLSMLGECIEDYKRALLLCGSFQNRRARVFVTIKLADAYRLNGNYHLALDNYYKYYEDPFIADSTDIPKWGIWGVIAESHEIIGEDVEAMKACLILQDLYLEDSMLAEGSYNLIQLGRIASHLESDTFYFEYYHRAVAMAYQSGSKPRIANNLVNLAIAYRIEGYPQKALIYYLEAKEYNEYSNPYPQAYYYINLAETYINLNRIEEALLNTRICFNLANKIDASVMKYAACSAFSRCYERLNENDSALIYLQMAFKYQSVTYMEKNSQAYRNLSNLSAKMKNYELALAYLDTSFFLFQKQIEKENIEKLAKLRDKSDYYIHKSRIGDLVIDNKNEREKYNRALVIASSIAVILGLAFVFVIILRRRHKQLKQTYFNLVEKNIALDKLNKQLNECELKKVSNGYTDNLKDEEKILKNLKKLMIKDEVFINSNISLPSLAKSLGTNTSYLSAIINTHYSCNLRSLINGYRITKAKEMLVSKEFLNYSIEGIATEVGFKSRSSFYQAFKSETGLNPALYLENYKLIERVKQ